MRGATGCTPGPGDGPVGRRSEMNAQVGDRIVIKGHHIGESERDGEILEVGPGGGPTYRVRWGDSGREALFFPGPDAVVQPLAPSRR